MTGFPPPKGACGFTELIRRARAGDHESLGAVLERCYHYLLAIAQKEVAPALRTKWADSDFVQQTFVHALQDFGRFEGETREELLAWLRHLLINRFHEVRRAYRAAKRDLADEVPFDDPARRGDEGSPRAEPVAAPDDVVAARERRARMWRHIDELPGRYRDVLHLWGKVRLPWAEIGALMGCSEQAARMLSRRAIRELSKLTKVTEAAG